MLRAIVVLGIGALLAFSAACGEGNKVTKSAPETLPAQPQIQQIAVEKPTSIKQAAFKPTKEVQVDTPEGVYTVRVVWAQADPSILLTSQPEASPTGAFAALILEITGVNGKAGVSPNHFQLKSPSETRNRDISGLQASLTRQWYPDRSNARVVSNPSQTKEMVLLFEIGDPSKSYSLVLRDGGVLDLGALPRGRGGVIPRESPVQ